MLSRIMRWTAGQAAFRIYAKGKHEAAWREIDVLATARRNSTSRLPFFGGMCITWSSSVIAVGWDLPSGCCANKFRRRHRASCLSR